MRFDFTVYADTASEVREALLKITATLPDDLCAKGRGFSIIATQEYQPVPMPVGVPCGEGWEVQVLTEGALTPAGEAALAASALSPSPAPRKRRTKAEMAADAAKAEASIQDEQPEPIEAEEAPSPVPEQVPDLAPRDAKLRALEILRECYALDGGPVAVRALQKTHGVAKFVDVPDATGHDLYMQALAIKTNLTTPKAA